MRALIAVSGDAGGGVLFPHIDLKYTRNGYISLVDMCVDGISDPLDCSGCTNWKRFGAFISQPDNKLVVRFDYRWQRHSLECNVPIEVVYKRGWVGSVWHWLWK